MSDVVLDVLAADPETVSETSDQKTAAEAVAEASGMISLHISS